ncbi:pentatricopeptide repeat-containing protein-like [Dorcoceras hygrometricum]|uniref:Pentatricopeptide repeat-containing protein-like n=1 Tax=Dorcoceras hygrometricum TaxID=472368 RepID=A0A2Z7D4H3_9LAMI|nr:pentatricopeptide repeat-containing protein-like [Dorcoceras hygrometricum]
MIESEVLNLKNVLARLLHYSKTIKEISQIHSQIVTSANLSSADRSFLVSRLLFFLCTVSNAPHSLDYAKKIFNLVPKPSLFMYNAMIRSNSVKINEPLWCESLVLYKALLHDDISPDCITFPFVLKECAKRVDANIGRSIHAHVVEFGCDFDVYVQNSLINLYTQCGILEDAGRVFDEMFNRDVVSWNSIIVGFLRGGELDKALVLFRQMKERKNIITWNSMITGLVQGGRSKEALEIFHEMQVLDDNKDLVLPDKITVASMLSACASLGAIDHGRWLHSYLERSGIECDMVIATALVDMYGKCGSIERAFDVFHAMPKRDVLAWTAIISTLALHGFGNEACAIFEEMVATGVRPNAVTFVALLTACAHSGLVEKGRLCYDVMRQDYCIEPEVQHYACMVGILGRAGLFSEAEEIIRNMPMKPDFFVWGALLGGCQLHGNVKLGERVSRFLIELEPENHAFYANLCDVYSKAGKFNDLKRIRSLMKAQEIQKTVPGCSMIEVDGVVYEFSVKGSPGLLMDVPKSLLVVLSNEMKFESYSSNSLWWYQTVGGGDFWS